jgi:hypothetical protein
VLAQIILTVIYTSAACTFVVVPGAAADSNSPVPEATEQPAAPSQIRIGVDVGGTFTKAIARPGGAGDRPIGAAHHSHRARGPAAGVVRVTADVAAGRGGTHQLVTHSTTQAVNAMLEGDVGTVGGPSGVAPIFDAC